MAFFIAGAVCAVLGFLWRVYFSNRFETPVFEAVSLEKETSDAFVALEDL